MKYVSMKSTNRTPPGRRRTKRNWPAPTPSFVKWTRPTDHWRWHRALTLRRHRRPKRLPCWRHREKSVIGSRDHWIASQNVRGTKSRTNEIGHGQLCGERMRGGRMRVRRGRSRTLIWRAMHMKTVPCFFQVFLQHT